MKMMELYFQQKLFLKLKQEKLKNKLVFTPRLKYYSFANEKSDNIPTTDSNSPCVKEEPMKMCTNLNYNNELKINNPRVTLLITSSGFSLETIISGKS